MARLTWDENMRVGVAEVDEQHRQLVRMIGVLDDAMATGSGHQVMGETIAGLVSYTRAHFATEESLFERYGYPDREAHKAQHDEFVARVEAFQTGFADGQLFLSLEVMDFLSDWLVEHIQGSDQRFGPFLNDLGVA